MRNGLVVMLMAIAFWGCSESFTDGRDGKSYKFVQIGDATWMAENLNFETEGSFCPEGGTRKCGKFGRLYSWDAAQKVCPAGWRLPSVADFESLLAAAGGAENAGAVLKSSDGWFKKKNGSDALGFAALPAGYRTADGKFDGIGGYAYFWSASENADGFANYLFLEFGSAAAAINALDKGSARSVRCVK